MGHVPAHTQLALHRCVASPDNENQFHSMCLKHKSIFQGFFWIWKLNFSNTDYFWISFVHLPANIGFFAIVVMVVTVVYGIASDWQSVWVLYTLSFFSHNSFGVTNGMPNACSNWCIEQNKLKLEQRSIPQGNHYQTVGAVEWCLQGCLGCHGQFQRPGDCNYLFFSQEQGRGTQVKLKAVTQINMQSVEKQVFFWNETSSWLVEMGK